MTELATPQKARFEAVRQRVFEEMRFATMRWRVALTVPFHGLVLGILAFRGASMTRLVIQTGAYLMFFVALGKAARGPKRAANLSAGIGAVALLVSVANTGGLASPLLIGTLPFMIVASTNPSLARKRAVIATVFFGALLVMAIFSRSSIGELSGPLRPVPPYATTEYVLLAFASCVVAFAAIYHMGRGVSQAYERIALELAERRAEICDENEGRTRALEGIAARMAHEVKNPLAAIKGLSTHMARSSTDPKTKERLAIVAAEAERLQEIVDGFLSFSRGLDDLTLGETSPYEIARELSLLLETRAADLGVELEVKGSRGLTLNADGRKLRQALLNLVLNAMQASPRESVVTLEIAKSCADGAAVIRVIDRGAGMSKEVLDRIERPYFTTKEGGSGLGVAVARGILEQHGGSLRIESAVGRGTTATIVLPACARDKVRSKLPNPCRWSPMSHLEGDAHEAASESPVLVVKAPETDGV